MNATSIFHRRKRKSMWTKLTSEPWGTCLVRLGILAN